MLCWDPVVVCVRRGGFAAASLLRWCRRSHFWGSESQGAYLHCKCSFLLSQCAFDRIFMLFFSMVHRGILDVEEEESETAEHMLARRLMFWMKNPDS